MKNDITGKKFNRLKAVRFLMRDAKSQYWEFLCDCGKTYISRKGDVVRGSTKSCGCLRSENRTTHGLSKTRIYGIWSGVITRGTNPNPRYSKHYYGKGIRVSKEWRKFENFYSDMNDSYEEHVKKYGIKNTTIDRIDGEKNYSKENCRWGSQWLQSRNKKSNIKYKGETASEASIRLSGKGWIVYSRLKNGWSLEKAFTTPKLK